MREIKHWAASLQVGDRVRATIRHKTDGSQNKVGVEVIVVAVGMETILAHYDSGEYLIPFNELTKPQYKGMSEDDIVKVIGNDNPWPLVDVLSKLVYASELLLHKHDHDGMYWEEISTCVGRAKETIEHLKKVKP